MAIQFDFPQNADPTKFSAADWQHAARRAKTTPSPNSVTPGQLASSTTALIDSRAVDAAATSLTEHVAQANPHGQYAQHDEVLAAADVARSEAVTTSATALADHVAAPDPHPGYVTPAAGDARYALRAEKDVASGHAGLNATSRTTKGVDTTDDLIIDFATKGLVLKDTQGTPHYWRITISNAGALVITDAGTTKP